MFSSIASPCNIIRTSLLSTKTIAPCAYHYNTVIGLLSTPNIVSIQEPKHLSSTSKSNSHNGEQWTRCMRYARDHMPWFSMKFIWLICMYVNWYVCYMKRGFTLQHSLTCLSGENYELWRDVQSLWGYYKVSKYTHHHWCGWMMIEAIENSSK